LRKESTYSFLSTAYADMSTVEMNAAMVTTLLEKFNKERKWPHFTTHVEIA